MNEKLYKFLCWIGRIVLPALATLILALGQIWKLPNAEEIAATITAVAVFLNAILMNESNKYFASREIFEKGE